MAEELEALDEDEEELDELEEEEDDAGAGVFVEDGRALMNSVFCNCSFAGKLANGSM